MDQNPSSPSPASGQSAPQKGSKFISALVGIVVAVIAGVYVMMQKKQSSSNMEKSSDTTNNMPEEAPLLNEPLSPVAPAPSEPTTVTPPAPVTSASEYKDGTYTAVGNYVSPGGPEQVGVTLTLKEDVIIDSVFEIKAQRPISKDKQTIFSQNYKQFVVGKNIDEVALTKVSSSSLTPKGFMDALAKIKAEAEQS